MDLLRRLFGRETPVAETATGCHICGAPADYDCEVCGKKLCIAHTAVGTASCTECYTRRAARHS